MIIADFYNLKKCLNEIDREAKLIVKNTTDKNAIGEADRIVEVAKKATQHLCEIETNLLSIDVLLRRSLRKLK